MNDKKNKKNVLVISMGLILLSALFNLVFLFSIPADIKNNFLFGFSLNRFLLGMIMVISFIMSIIFLRKIIKEADKVLNVLEKILIKPVAQTAIHVILLIIFIAVFFVFFPPQELKINHYYLSRIQPLAIFLLTVAIVINIIQFFFTPIPRKSDAILLIAIGSILLIIFLAISIIFPIINNGKWSDSSSVPILLNQIGLGLLIVTLFLVIKNKLVIKCRHLDWIIFIGLWIIAAVLWINEPITFLDNYQTTKLAQHIKPCLPNYSIYPAFDSSTYFAITESVYIGTGITRSVDKPLFLAFESLNRFLAGGDYSLMLNFQTAILAILPGFVYLLGKELSNRAAAIFAASMEIMHEINTIKSMKYLPLVSTKTLLSEPFVKLGIVLIALYFVLSLKDAKKGSYWKFIVCGGLSGLFILFRVNMLVVAIFLLFLIVIIYFKNKKILLNSVLLFSVGVSIALLPWSIRNTIIYHDPFISISAKVEGVVIEKRYEPLLDINSDQLNPLPESTETVNDVTSTHDRRFGDEIKVIFKKVNKHFINNLIAGSSIFPNTISSENQQFWEGNFLVNPYAESSFIFLIFNFLFLVLGLFASMKKCGIAGLIPLGIYLAYHFSNSLGLASGNRYAQPVTSVVILYYSIGIICFMQWLIPLINVKYEEKNNVLVKRDKQKGIIWLALLILFIGSMPIVADQAPRNLFPEREYWIDRLIFMNDSSNFPAVLSDGYSGVNLLEEKDYFAIGKILFPIIVDKQQYEEIFGRTLDLDAEWFYTFYFLDGNTGNYKQKIFIPDDPNLVLNHDDDFVIYTRNSDPTEEIPLMGKLQTDTFSRDKNLNEMNSIPIICFLSKDINSDFFLTKN